MAPVNCRWPPMSCSPRPRSSGGWRAGADAGRALDAALPGRARADGGADREGRDRHLALGGVEPVRRADRDRPGRAAGRGPVLAGSGGADGRRVQFGEHTVCVALGIDIDGTKHPLSLVEGSTENTTLITDLVVGLREWGLDVTRPILVVLDGDGERQEGATRSSPPRSGRGRRHPPSHEPLSVVGWLVRPAPCPSGVVGPIVGPCATATAVRVSTLGG
jgi:hypothetical protein